ncbi:MAG: NEW3 domain-containing protein, partial [Candidatus Aenigmatarchaeota archaeon]
MNKKILLIVLFFSFSLLITSYAYACVLISQTFYTNPPVASNPFACVGPTVTEWDFEGDMFNSGCACGISVCCWYEQLNPPLFPIANCYGPEAKWRPCPGSEGQICKLRSGLGCEDTFQGVWDTDDSQYGAQCVQCSGNRQSTGRRCGTTAYSLRTTCEQACGASQTCDDGCPSMLYSSTTICDSNCQTAVCSSSRNCNSLIVYPSTWCYTGDVSGTTKRCTYDGSSWAWRDFAVAENTDARCSDGVDNDCDGSIDCLDSNCNGLGDCCQTNLDCGRYRDCCRYTCSGVTKKCTTGYYSDVGLCQSGQTCSDCYCVWGTCSPSDCEKCSTQSGWTMTFCPGNCASGSCTNDPCICVAGECGAHCTGPAAGLWCTSGSTCYYGTCGINSCTIPSGGSCTVTGCVPPTTYDFTFYQNGLPSNTNWGVSLDGSWTLYSSGFGYAYVRFSGLTGSHSYAYTSVSGCTCTSGCSGTVSSAGSRTATYTCGCTNGQVCGTSPCTSSGCQGTTWYNYPATCNRICSGGTCPSSCTCSPTSTIPNDPRCIGPCTESWVYLQLGGCGAYCNWAGTCESSEICMLYYDENGCSVSPGSYYCIVDASCPTTSCVCTPYQTSSSSCNYCNGFRYCSGSEIYTCNADCMGWTLTSSCSGGSCACNMARCPGIQCASNANCAAGETCNLATCICEGTSCVRYNPVVSVSPASQSGDRVARSYTVTIRNTDTSSCGSNTFTLSRSCPSGWTCTLSSSSITLSPGSSGTRTITVDPPSTASIGTYSFSVTATSGSYSGSGSANYVVEASVPVCTPNGCNGNCPSGCTVSQDPDCGCSNNNGCCGIGCIFSNDNDCADPCAGHCSNGYQDCGETGVDCGGGGCAACADCSSGDCCDPSGFFRPSSYVCGSQTEYGCSGTGCGADVTSRTRPRYCSGSSASCSGSYGTWSGWTTYDYCSSIESCTWGDSSCNYASQCDCTDDCSGCSDCGGGSDCTSYTSCTGFSSTCDETGLWDVTTYQCSDIDSDVCLDCSSSTATNQQCSRVTDGWYCSLCELCNTNGACNVLMPDDTNCGTIDCSLWYVQTGTESVTGTEYCYNKYDITSNRCEAADSNSCKDDNTADCSPQGNDAVQYSCG